MAMQKRSIQTGIGPVEVGPRVRDPSPDTESARIRFTSAVLPAYLRRTRNVEELLPWLYLKGISTGEFEDTLKVLLGPDAPGLSAATIRRLVATGRTSISAGRHAICRPSGISTSGRTGSTSRRGSSTTANAS
jgi:hypothetical protein